MRFDVFTLFPAMFLSPFADSILRRAIDAVLANQPVDNAVTHAIGCTIKWKL